MNYVSVAGYKWGQRACPFNHCREEGILASAAFCPPLYSIPLLSRYMKLFILKIWSRIPTEKNETSKLNEPSYISALTYQNVENNFPIGHIDGKPHIEQFRFHDEEMQDLFHQCGCPSVLQTPDCNKNSQRFTRGKDTPGSWEC